MPWRNDATPRNTMKPNSIKEADLDGKAGVLHGEHMGGHSDVADIETKLTIKPIAMNTKHALNPNAPLI